MIIIFFTTFVLEKYKNIFMYVLWSFYMIIIIIKNK